MRNKEKTSAAKGRRWLRRGLIVLGAIFAMGAGSFVAFAAWASPSRDTLLPQVDIALQSDDRVSVTEGGWLAFFPNDALPKTGVILYQGGRVLSEAYAPLARQLAQAGYLAIIPYSPLNLAILDTSAASAIITAYPAIENWVVGGHSLGGTSAAIFASDNLESVDGLILMASRPANDALATATLPVLSIYGARDGIFTLDELEESVPDLPANTQFVAIEGGNHAQFGYYGTQEGDTPATISREAQIQQTAEAILSFLATLD